VIVELATFRQRVYLLKSGLSVCIGVFFPIETISENELTVSIIATSEELERVITIEVNDILYRIMKVE
jgi:hypothetical protein